MLKNTIRKFFSNEEEKELENILSDILKEADAEGGPFYTIDFTQFNSINEMLNLEDNNIYLENFIHYCSIVNEHTYSNEPLSSIAYWVNKYLFKNIHHDWSTPLLINIFQHQRGWHYFTIDEIFLIIEKKIKQEGANSEIEALIKILRNNVYYHGSNQSERVFINKLGLLLKETDTHSVSKEALLSEELEELSKISNSWLALIEACETEGMKSNTTKKWLLAQSTLIKNDIGIDIFSLKIQFLIEKANQLIIKSHQTGYDFWQSDEQKRLKQNYIFKALLWNCGISEDKELHSALFNHTEIAFKKKQNIGVLSQQTGAAALFAFSQLPIQEGVPKLMSLKNKITNKTILKSIEKYIKEAAKNGGLCADNIEEISIPNYGMEEVGVLKTTFGTISASTTFKPNGKNETTWDNNGKNQTSVPASVKTDFAKELKFFKNTIKEIEQLLPSQRNRIENQYLTPISWIYKDWFSLYISHPVVGILGQRLIWYFNQNGKKYEGIFNKNHFENAMGEPLTIDDTATVQLWHPIGFDAEYIEKWRNYLIKNEIVQPFKQAFREVYIVTEAELNTVNYSNRFAAHILRQHQFTALAKLRDWRYTLQGNWDSHNTPFKTLKHCNITARYFVDAIDAETSHAGAFNFVATDQVRFYRNTEQLNIQEVPAMVFTEIMRDVDMYVGVCSIGNDPNWQNNPNGQHQTYWQSYSFRKLTETAKTRAAVLKNLVPRLKIASLCSFEGSFLLVKGKIRTYKIHLGSGNILMTPNDQYLCIVPDGSKKVSDEKVFLPFEGDAILSIILSKAFLLAEDDKITDSTIVRQIK